MFARKSSMMTIAGAALAGAAVLTIGQQVRAGGDKVAFPESYAKGILYTTVDRVDIKQFRELYAPAAAIEAVKKGQPVPPGTVITMVHYKVQLDAQGNPVKDANGRLIKTEISAYEKEVARIFTIEPDQGPAGGS